MSIQEIYNYIKVNDRVSTAGMPTAEQIHATAAEGFDAVINLATMEPGHSLENEAELVQSLGMQYYHIPVVWSQPKAEDFTAFEAAMDGLAEQKILIHCAANFRVTAFYSLYGLKNLGWTTQQAQTFREQIWQGRHIPAWDAFIHELERRISTGMEPDSG